MLLTEKVLFPVKPVPGRNGWYQIDGVPKDLGYADIGDWLGDEVYCGADEKRSQNSSNRLPH
jgi:predicted P-loop ATPase/GTPase